MSPSTCRLLTSSRCLTKSLEGLGQTCKRRFFGQKEVGGHTVEATPILLRLLSTRCSFRNRFCRWYHIQYLLLLYLNLPKDFWKGRTRAACRVWSSSSGAPEPTCFHHNRFEKPASGSRQCGDKSNGFRGKRPQKTHEILLLCLFSPVFQDAFSRLHVRIFLKNSMTALCFWSLFVRVVGDVQHCCRPSWNTRSC